MKKRIRVRERHKTAIPEKDGLVSVSQRGKKFSRGIFCVLAKDTIPHAWPRIRSTFFEKMIDDSA